MKNPSPAALGADERAVLADARRLAGGDLLLKDARHVTVLDREIRIARSLLSPRLRDLREAGAVLSRRDGRAVLPEAASGVAEPDDRSAVPPACCRFPFECIDFRKT